LGEEIESFEISRRLIAQKSKIPNTTLIKTAQTRSTVLKNRAERGFFLRCQPRKFENVTLLAHRREHFRGFWAIFLVAELPQKISCFNAQEFTRFLSAVVVSTTSHAL